MISTMFFILYDSCNSFGKSIAKFILSAYGGRKMQRAFLFFVLPSRHFLQEFF